MATHELRGRSWPTLLWCGLGSTVALGTAFLLASLASGGAGAVISAPALDLESAATRLTAEIQALRQGDCPKALDGLGKRSQDAEARLLQGFAAAHCRAHGLAVDRLATTGAANEIEDWRLWTLAQSENALGHASSARRALQELLAEYPGSPLAPRAHLEAAKAAWRAGATQEAIHLLEPLRDRPLDRESRRAADSLAWEIAKGSGDRDLQQTVARRLLIDSPLEAAQLQVVDALRAASGAGLDWTTFSDADLLRRANALVDAQIPAGALMSLEAIPAGRRTTRWVALKARALALGGQGLQALAVLDNATRSGAPEADLVELYWAEAEACEQAITPRRGVPQLPAADRARLGLRREAALWQVAKLGASVPHRASARRAESALRLIFAETSSAASSPPAGRYSDSLQALRELRRLVPSDLSGAPFLWKAAWGEYRAGRDAIALERWSALEALYPESRYSRSGTYWSARALERLGRGTEAAAVLRNLALADTSDFYRRHALARLGGKEPARSPNAPARAAWPSEPAIERARLLSDLGLDQLALSELDALDLANGGAAPARSSTALRALALSRRGERRESLRLLASAFPALGSANQAELPELALDLYYPLDYAATVQQLARAQGLPPSLVFGIIHQESAFDHRAISRSGARGLMQLMPPTAKELARRLRMPYSLQRMSEPDYSVRLGTTYFRQVLDTFDGRVEIALAGYNAGPNRIRRLWQEAGGGGEIDTFVEDLAIDETKVYVKRIVAISDSYRRLHPGIG